MVDSPPTVSVLLPVTNPHPPFFLVAVRSILEQAFEDFELCIVEAPSHESAGALLAEFDDPRIHHVRLAAPTTLVDQLNHGLAMAQGTFVARMDADDIARFDRLAKQLRLFEEQPDLDVVGSQLAVIDEAGRTIGTRKYPVDHESIVTAMRRFNPMAHPAVLFRRATVVDAGGYRHPERAAQDYELWCRLASSGKRFANHEEPLLQYRLHPGAIKVERLRDTIRSTLAVKQAYWSDAFTWRDRLRIGLERLALRAPASLVLWAFRKTQYRASSTKTPSDHA